MRSSYLALLLALLSPSESVGSLKDYPFRIEVREDGQGSVIVLRNDGPSTMSARLVLSGDNVAIDRLSPIDIVAPRYSTQSLVRMRPAVQGVPMQITYRTSHHFGDAGARHDQATLYRLPFEDGRTFRIAQTFGGVLTTHVDERDRHAIDIEMPEGTPIVAARGGIVVDVATEHFAGATDPKLLDRANSVSILHDDGTIAIYAHLAQGSAVVSRGQRVTAGQRIGFSGNTGFSSGPHLHFAVSRPSLNSAGVMEQFALPVTFFLSIPPVPIVLRQGMSATANYNVLVHEPMSRLPPTAHTDSAPSPQKYEVSATTTRSNILDQPASNVPVYHELMRERSGLPTWGWLVALLGIWLFHRNRRRAPTQRLGGTPRREPRIGPKADQDEPQRAFSRQK